MPYFLVFLIGLAISYPILRLLIKTSYKIIGMENPKSWMFIMIAIGGITLYASTLFPIDHIGLDVVQIASLLAFFVSFNDIKKMDLEYNNPLKSISRAVDELSGTTKGPKYYKIGHYLFLISAIITWILLYAESV